MKEMLGFSHIADGLSIEQIKRLRVFLSEVFATAILDRRFCQSCKMLCFPCGSDKEILGNVGEPARDDHPPDSLHLLRELTLRQVKQQVKLQAMPVLMLVVTLVVVLMVVLMVMLVAAVMLLLNRQPMLQVVLQVILPRTQCQ